MLAGILQERGRKLTVSLCYKHQDKLWSSFFFPYPFYFSTQAVSHFEIPLEEVIPSQQLVRNICEDLIHIQVNTIIRANAKEFKSRTTVTAWKTSLQKYDFILSLSIS